MKLPKGYEGGVMVEMRKKLTSEDIEEPKQLKIVGTFDQLHCWNLDRKPSANDPFPRALQWLELAEALHGTTE